MKSDNNVNDAHLNNAYSFLPWKGLSYTVHATSLQAEDKQ